MKRAKRLATGLLILASIVFVIAHLLIRDIDGDTFNETTREGSLSGWAVVLPYVGQLLKLQWLVLWQTGLP